MIYTIENEEIRVRVKEFGAELTSFFDKKTQTEYLWSGDARIWGGQSPVLFPIIGRLKNDTYRLNGRSYTMPKHGLARKMPFTVVREEENAVTFLLTEDEQTLQAYPFRFRLLLTFSLEGRRLTVRHTVENVNEERMYFSLGAHPAFVCQIGDCLTFEQKETQDTALLDLSESLRTGETRPVLRDENTIRITEHIFDEDALIFRELRSSLVTLEAFGGTRNVKFRFHSPYLGIWAKPGAPYVCLEPWYGVNDSYTSTGNIEEKEGIIALDAGESFTADWSAEI